MKYHVVFVIFCVVISLYVVALYNLALVLPRKPTLRLTQRNNSTWSFHDIKGKRRQNKETIQATTEMEGNTGTSENKQGLQFIKEISLALQNRKKLIEEKGESQHRQKRASRTNLIILSPGRGGSSFLGAIFDNNPETMYWYEPLHTISREVFKLHLTKGKEPVHYKETCNNVIDSFFKCDFSNINKVTLSKLSQTIFRYRSKSLTSGYLCPDGEKTSRCPPFSKTLLSKACNSYKHTVIKILTSRVPNRTIESFQELFQQQDRYDVKLIHLVRDPRAVVYSMVNSVKWIEKNYSDQDFRSHLHGICDTIEQNIRMGLLNPPSWLRNRFKVIRFEDLSVNTVNIARELYRFAGFDWSMSVNKWITSHNRPPSNAKESDAYSLYRNASDVIDKWKNAPKDLIRAVEESCGDLMDMLGYDKFRK
ncbi:carbohydrate sulfotransferase 3-like [Oculina patagonica]